MGGWRREGHVTKRRRDPVAVGDLIDAVLGKVARADVAPIVRLRQNWQEVAGEWADRCRPVGLREGALTVEVASGLDASMLRYDAHRLVESVARHLGGTAEVTRLAIRVGGASRGQND